LVLPSSKRQLCAVMLRQRGQHTQLEQMAVATQDAMLLASRGTTPASGRMALLYVGHLGAGGAFATPMSTAAKCSCLTLPLTLLLLLQDVRKFKLGLYYALRFHHTAQQQQQQQQQRSSHSSSESHGLLGGGGSAGGLKPRASVGGLGRSEGLGAEPQQLEQWMLSLMLGHASATLQESAGQQQQQDAAAGSDVHLQPTAAVCAAAEICLCTCLLLGRPDVLFARAYPLFARPPAAAGAAAAAGGGPGSSSVAAFMGALEVAVLSDLLLGLDPEVMQVGLGLQVCAITPSVTCVIT
jgi:hypothetical protein